MSINVQFSSVQFLPNFSLVDPSVLNFGSGRRQTDGQTNNGHQRLMAPQYGGGCIIIVWLEICTNSAIRAYVLFLAELC